MLDDVRTELTRLPERGARVDDGRQQQPNIVFPDTVQNEQPFWRDRASGRLHFLQWIGFLVLGVFAFGSFGFIILTSFRMAPHQPGSWWHTAIVPVVYWLEAALLVILIFGPIFLLVIWGTRRSLRALARKKEPFSNEPPEA